MANVTIDETPEGLKVPGIYVPNYMSFHNENTYIGSYDGLRFKLTPNLEEENIRAELWFGPLCYEKSQMFTEETFPLTQEGIDQMEDYLVEQAKHNPDPLPEYVTRYRTENH